MLAQYLVSLRAANLRKLRTKSVMAVNSPQVNKQRTFHIRWWKLSTSFSKNTFYDKASGSDFFSLCSYFSTKFQTHILKKLLL